MPARLRNVFGVFALVGIPWLVLIVVAFADNIGHFRLYAWGNDYWMYQRFGYRIVMQGYWLEGRHEEFLFPAVLSLGERPAPSRLRRFEHRRILLGRRLLPDRRAARVLSHEGVIRFPVGRARGGDDADGAGDWVAVGIDWRKPQRDHLHRVHLPGRLHGPAEPARLAAVGGRGGSPRVARVLHPSEQPADGGRHHAVRALGARAVVPVLPTAEPASPKPKAKAEPASPKPRRRRAR